MGKGIHYGDKCQHCKQGIVRNLRVTRGRGVWVGASCNSKQCGKLFRLKDPIIWVKMEKGINYGDTCLYCKQGIVRNLRVTKGGGLWVGASCNSKKCERLFRLRHPHREIQTRRKTRSYLVKK